MSTTERAAGRPRNPETEATIIEAVLELIAAGATLSGLSLVSIAAAAGVSRNSVYRRWKTKDALYLDVLSSINRPLPLLSGRTVRDDVIALLQVLVERTLDRRASHVLRVLNAEASTFPELHRRYFDEIVSPRREAMYQVLSRGIATGEIRAEIDVPFVTELLVGSILARMGTGMFDSMDPAEISQRIVEVVFEGVRPR